MKTAFKKVRGVTLVELLVSMAIGGVILSGCVVVYLDQLQSSRRLTAYAHLQDSGRVALEILEQDLRMSAFTGCFSSNEEMNNTLANTFPASFQPEVGIQGWEAADTGPGETIVNVLSTTAVVESDNGSWETTGGNILDQITVIPNSDILRIWGVGETDMVVNSIIAGTPNILTVDVTNEVDDDAILMLSDCQSVDIVQACDVTVTGTQTRISLGDSCSPGNNNSISLKSNPAQTPTLTTLRGTVYVVSKQNGLATNPPSLFRAELNSTGAVVGNLEEVVEGVESMQILYGENLDDDNFRSADTYVTADNVQVWENVVSVRISLLMQSVNDNLSQGVLPYVFNGVTYNGLEENPSASDNRLRRVFSRTISLRNRTLGS